MNSGPSGEPGAAAPGGDDEWDRLIRGVRAGDPESMRAFYGRYRPALERLAASAIDTGMRRRFGPESVAHSVCRTFLRRAQGGALDVPDADALWRLLCAVALNKVREQTRYHRRLRRAVGAEARGESAAEALERAASQAEAAEDAVAFRDQLEHVVASLSDTERRIVELRLAGRTQEETADEIGCTERTIRRTLARLEARLTQAFAP